METLLTTSLLIINVLIITTVWGCGVMPPGQERTKNLIVSGFSLPVSMVYSGETTIRIKAPGIAPTKEAAKGSIERLVMQTVFDVLEQQGRSAVLSDALISTLLSQLRIQINYDPLECQGATVSEDPQAAINGDMNKVPHCIIIGGTVTGTCRVENARVDCGMIGTPMKTAAISTNYTMFSGTLTTTNIIMANWSREMWQRVVNRAIRMLASASICIKLLLRICNCHLKHEFHCEVLK
ncbi:hypothetical protein KIN20_009180 [Parelaphostrongylus tenuis]|uniref:Uncharacterized protein n=1 Tax=Parelaphostrongylus tenuis TaxID=148309 RepID=A0AAD5M5X8_PARTN|nr:hypothetical protein KIN20_009180 [Parelaphostrongylus tenuis]